MLNNGSGGIDWTGLPYAVELYQVENVALMVERMLAIKGHRPPKVDKPDEEGGS